MKHDCCLSKHLAVLLFIETTLRGGFWPEQQCFSFKPTFVAMQPTIALVMGAETLTYLTADSHFLCLSSHAGLPMRMLALLLGCCKSKKGAVKRPHDIALACCNSVLCCTMMEAPVAARPNSVTTGLCAGTARWAEAEVNQATNKPTEAGMLLAMHRYGQ